MQVACRIDLSPAFVCQCANTLDDQHTKQRVDKIKARSPQEALQFTGQELMGMLKEATGSLKRFAAPGGMEGLTGPLGIVQVRGRDHCSPACLRAYLPIATPPTRIQPHSYPIPHPLHQQQQVGADLAAVDQLALVKFAAFISVNLAVVNALPFPGLDGGQVRFTHMVCLRDRSTATNKKESKPRRFTPATPTNTPTTRWSSSSSRRCGGGASPRASRTGSTPCRSCCWPR